MSKVVDSYGHDITNTVVGQLVQRHRGAVSVILPIHPKWAKMIYEGRKTVEVRRTAPRSAIFDGWVYLYECGTRDACKRITGRVRLTEDEFAPPLHIVEQYYPCRQRVFEGIRKACLTAKEYDDYAKGKDVQLWYLAKPERFKVSLPCKVKRPQTWQYLIADNIEREMREANQ